MHTNTHYPLISQRRLWREWKTCELYCDYNCHFLDTAGLQEAMKFLKLKKKSSSSSFADKKKVQLSLTGNNLVIFLATFGLDGTEKYR